MTFEPYPPPRLAQLDPPAAPNARRAGGRWNQGRPMLGRMKQDGGAAIVLLSAVMLFLLGMAAFAVDLGWLWLNASRIQSAADAAALSGVTHLPANAGQAQTSAENAARVNGWPVGGSTTLTSSVGANNTLDVTLTASVDTYFLRVFGQPQVTIQREATAQYILPVPLGSPFSNFGDNSQNFFASIAGEWTHLEHGDPFATRCIESDDPMAFPVDQGCDIGGNGQYRGSPFGGGYFIGVEVQPGTTSLSLNIYDPGYFERDGVNDGTGEVDIVGGSSGPDTHYRFYRADATPYDLTDMTPHGTCNATFAAIDKNPATGTHDNPPPAWVNNWYTLCTVTNPAPGLHVLQVRTDDGGNNNMFGIEAAVAGPPARVYGIDSIGVFTNVSNVADLYLAEIKPVHAGKTLRVSFFDAGDAAGDASLTVQTPNGATAGNCSWSTRSGSDTGSSCAIQTTSGGSNFSNGDWIDVEIQIPDTYTCDETSTTGCWWTVKYDYSASPSAHDRTTWQIEVIGNPVRLIVDAP